jgi:glutaminyl-peptide cyclotransferase
MRGRARSRLLAAFLLVVSLAIPVDSADSKELAEERDLVLMETTPHDPTAFTQGLEVHGNLIIESTGLYGHSGLREIDPSSGDVLRETKVDEAYFGEGITVFDSTVIMLTWTSGTALVFDLETLSLTSNFSYEGEGWGLCFDGQYFVMSNGSSELAFRDPVTFEIRRSVTVISNDEEIDRLNELECVGSTIYANVWGQDRIIAINSSSGAVEFYVSAASLAADQGHTKNEVLNGIAFDENKGGFWITGKNWTEMYLVSFESKSTDNPNASTADEEQRDTNDHTFVNYFILGIFFLSIIMIGRRLKHQQPPPPSEVEQSVDAP